MTSKTIIEPQTGWQLIDWRELWHYRDLFFFLVWRDIKTRYAHPSWLVARDRFSICGG